jgi:hypothetical protein
MKKDDIKQKLYGVLKTIQEISGLACPTLQGATKPVKDLKGFDSKVWPVAISMLAGQIGATIPTDVDIFYDKKSSNALSIDQAVDMVLGIIDKQEKKKEQK